ncbi:cupin domain-containing protein [Spartinivicinus ruber]|uniref:cupin domain-containing protein n=1 Tax=Spartinivicinus ruber TaxID=2683272 RepID=UPI0013D32A00|nr:cupin domain-containing protein [Spartinivicinus ruber]
MNHTNFPLKIQQLETFSNRFEAFKLNAENCKVLFAMYPGGSVIEPHSHNTGNCGVVTRGKLYLTVDGQESEYSPGDWYQVSTNQVHSARFLEDTEAIEFWFSDK